MGRIAASGAAIALVLATAAFAPRAVIPLPDLTAHPVAGVVPKHLPRRERAPVRFELGSEFTMLRGGIPPVLSELVVHADRNGSLDVEGLPACGRRQVQRFDTAAVEAACRDSIVGRGEGTAVLAYPENAPIPVSSKLLVVNGGARGRVTTFFVRGVVPIVSREVFLSTVKVETVDEGPYGLRATAKVPPIAGGKGFVTDFDVVMKKRYGYEGEQHSVIEARCAGGTLSARATMAFADRESLAVVLLRACDVRR